MVPEVFREAAKKTSVNGGTESHFHAVDSCQICHLSNYAINLSAGCYTIPPIRNKGQILSLLKSYWCSTTSQLTPITRGFLSLQETEKKTSGILVIK